VKHRASTTEGKKNTHWVTEKKRNGAQVQHYSTALSGKNEYRIYMVGPEEERGGGEETNTPRKLAKGRGAQSRGYHKKNLKRKWLLRRKQGGNQKSTRKKKKTGAEIT